MLGSIDVSVSDESHTDVDSHSDQCAVGDNALIIHDYERPISVSGYDPTGPVAQDLKTVSAAIAYDDAVLGETVSYTKQFTFPIWRTTCFQRCKSD